MHLRLARRTRPRYRQPSWIPTTAAAPAVPTSLIFGPDRRSYRRPDQMRLRLRRRPSRTRPRPRLRPSPLIVSTAGIPRVTAATDLLWVYDYLDRQTMTLHALFVLELDDRLQDSETLKFTIAADDPKAEFVLTDGLCRYRDRWYRINKRDPGRDGARAVIECEAEARWIDLAGHKRVGSYVLIDQTPRQGLTEILSPTDWTVGTVEGDIGTFTIDKTDASVLELVRAWAAITGLEVVFDTANRQVDFLVEQGTVRDIGFRYGWNLQGIKKRESPPEATVLYAYGRNGLTIVGPNPSDEEFIEDFSFYTDQGLTEGQARARFTRVQTWVDVSFVSDQPLYDAAVARLTVLAQPKISYEAKTVDIAAALGVPLEFELGDTVPVHDGTLGITVRTRVVRKVHRPLVPAGDDIELAYLQLQLAPSTSFGRGSDIVEWLLFTGDSTAGRTVDANLQILADIGLQFAQGGDAVHHLDAVGTATGTGTLRVTFYDEIGNTIIGPVIDIPFTAGPVHVPSAFGLDDLAGDYLFSVRAQVVSGTGSVVFAADATRYSILARNGLGVTVPPDENSVTYDFDDAGAGDGTVGLVQTFDVPPGVTSITVDCYGAEGQAVAMDGGKGGRVRARIPVTAGETLNVYVGGKTSSSIGTGGWNGGGDGGHSTNDGGGGGGAADVRRGSTLADRLVVAGGGAGAGNDASVDGGAGGYPTGQTTSGAGGTQSAGGAAGGGNATAGTLGIGGRGHQLSLQDSGGGGGGGLYGGGGGASAGSGGGGSGGTPAAGATEILAETGVRSGHGQVVISWDEPI